MNHLLELMRLHLSRQDDRTESAQVIREELSRLERGEPAGPDGTLDFRRRSMRVVPRLSDPVTTANGGSHIFTLRKHPVAPGTGCQE